MIYLRTVLATNLKIRRKSMGITQEKLAELVNTAPTYIAMIEAERRTPSFKMIERLAEALKIDAPELFSMEKFPLEPISEIHASLIDQFDKFLRSAQKEIIKENK